MDAVRIESDGSIKLPRTVLRRFPEKSELAVWSQGEVIVLKRLKPLQPTVFAQRGPGEELSIEEVDAEVQAHRKEKRARRA
ncbi:MAG: hypothetical protein ACE5HV_13765 [Acidobacteriota bacterium]